MDVFKLVGRIVVDTKEAIKNIDKTTDTAKKSESKITGAFKAIGESLKQGLKTEKAEEFTSSMEKLSTKINGQQEKLDKLKNKYKELYITHEKNSDEAKAVAKEIEELSSELKKIRIS